MDDWTFDEAYVARLADGDPAVAGHFTRHFGDLLRIKLRRTIRSPQLAEDIRQETLLRVLAAVKMPGKVESPERLGAYVHSVCRNVTFEMVRASGRMVAGASELALDPPDPSANTLDSMISAERDEALRAVIGGMDDRDRRLLVSVFFEEKDKDAVCREARVDRNYLRVLLFRARSRFRVLLEKQAKSHGAH